MALQVWLPLNKNGAYQNQGLANISVDNSAVYSDSGKLGGCYFYRDGLCQSINNNLTSIIGEKRSICVWVKPAGNHIHYTGAIVSSGNWNDAERWVFGVNSDNTGVTGFGNRYNMYLPCNIPVNEWTHLACVTNGTHHDIYKNGSYVGSLTCGSSLLYSTASNTTIGRETYAEGYFEFNGCLNDVRIYDHCLSPKEVKEIAKGLVLHYPLNDAYIEGTVNLGNTSASYSNMTDGHEFAATSWGGDAGTVTYYKSGGYNNLPYKVYHKTASGSGGIYYKTANDISIVAGKTYTMSVWVKASRNFLGIGHSFNINGVTPSDNNHYITYYKQVPFTTEWTRISRTFTATESDAGMYGEMSIIYDDWDTDYYVYFSGFQIEEKDHTTPYTPSTRNESTVYDCSGYQNNGTVSGLLSCSNDSPRYKVSSTTTSDFSILKSGGYNVPEGPLTVSFWQSPLDKTYANSENTSSINISFGKFYYFNYLNYPYFYYNGMSRYKFVNYWADGKWHMVTCVFNGTTPTLYIDGETVSGIKTGTNSDTNTYTSNIDISSTRNSLSDFRIYATALSAEDIRELYNTSAYVANNGTLLAYNLEE